MQNGNSYKCLPMIDRADKVIYGSSEVLVLQHRETIALANSMLQNHHWVNFVSRYVIVNSLLLLS